MKNTKQQIASTKLPTLEEARKHCSFIKKPLNGLVVLMQAVAPRVSTNGIVVGASFQEKAQDDLNRSGVLVVQVPSIDNLEVQDGNRATYKPECTMVFSRVITTNELYDGLELEEGSVPSKDMYKQYVILVISVYDLTLILENEI